MTLWNMTGYIVHDRNSGCVTRETMRNKFATVHSAPKKMPKVARTFTKLLAFSTTSEAVQDAKRFAKSQGVKAAVLLLHESLAVEFVIPILKSILVFIISTFLLIKPHLSMNPIETDNAVKYSIGCQVFLENYSLSNQAESYCNEKLM